MSNTSRVMLVDLDQYDIPVADDLELPSGLPYVLVDEDMQECRQVSWDEIEPLYIDLNIRDFRIRPDPFNMAGIDEQELTLVVFDGREFTMPLGAIEDSDGEGQYFKQNELIWPIDDLGARLLNRTMTPRLAQLREQVHDLVREISQQQLEIAEIVCSFAAILSRYGDMANMARDLASWRSSSPFPE